ncbi:hypothetical protein XELAEV_18034817mg [Xenopus laevis]|uniref:Uncharacterized protein n=1 Tax=Xenopus laevis TaxID=8355 RepID=A0A974HBH7_XENLA|nr:hypothetical protein XELAEV_18034817mg [Xenopus laevis]
MLDKDQVDFQQNIPCLLFKGLNSKGSSLLFTYLVYTYIHKIHARNITQIPNVLLYKKLNAEFRLRPYKLI